MKSFLENYCKETKLSESTLRKNYLEMVYESKLNEIRAIIGDSCIWISVYKTTNALGQSIANVIVDKIDEEKP